MPKHVPRPLRTSEPISVEGQLAWEGTSPPQSAMIDFARAGALYAPRPTLVKCMGAGALILIMSHLSRRH